MANWLLDYIEMTEYIPSELREQLTSIRELDLQVHNAMDELERDIKQFFSKINTLSPQERQNQYDLFLKKCDVATRAASDKVKVADKLHDLVEKSMRLLDQGLEKLKEDLLEGDKAYVVEDLERKSQELDEQLRLEQETMIQRQDRLHEPKISSKSQRNINENNSYQHVNSSQNNHHRHSNLAHQNFNDHKIHNNHNHNYPNHQQNNHLNPNHRNRNNSTSVQNTNNRHKKRERQRSNSNMTIFNRNSRSEDDSTSQSYLSSPLTPDYLTGANRNLNDVVVGNNASSLTMKGMMACNRNSSGIFDKINGNDPLAGAKQPVLTAIDAAHAVSPKATNSDKIVLFSNNLKGDKFTPIHNSDKQGHPQPLSGNQHPYHLNQLGNHLLPAVGFTSGDSAVNSNPVMSKTDRNNHDQNNLANAPFSALPLSSRHDPIMMAASQAINATQNMTTGRRTSSLKASYAAVNSGRLQPSPNQQLFEQGGGMIHEVYCKCRSHIQGSNMIACDNSKCKIEWFHYECVGITTPPEGEWFCDECKISQKNHKQAKLEGVNVT